MRMQDVSNKYAIFGSASRGRIGGVRSLLARAVQQIRGSAPTAFLADSTPSGASMIKQIGFVLIALWLCSTAKAQQPASTSDFALVDGDRVVFYGDSITEQRLYTTDIENFVRTRFPDRHVLFFHSGVGGDRVSGGKYGPIDLRLHRDVFEHQPTVVTIMLGMNDGLYQAFDPDIFTSYKNGYVFIVNEIQKNFPQARLTLLKPSPYDDVTRPTMMVGGYNKVLQRFGGFVGELAAEKK